MRGLKEKKKKGKGIIPKLKKSLGSFAKGETGKISKQSLLTVGSIVGGAAIGAAISTKTAGAGIRFFSGSGKAAQSGGVDRGGTIDRLSSLNFSNIEGKGGGYMVTVDTSGNSTITLTVTPNGDIVGQHSHHSSY